MMISPRSWSAPAALLGATMLIAACGGADARQVPAPHAAAVRDTALISAAAVQVAGFELVRAERLPWRDAWRMPGRLVLDARTTQTLGAIAEGRVTRVLVMPGDRVRRGQLLVAIHSHEMMDAREAERTTAAAMARAESELALANEAAARAERLFVARAMSQSDLERARTAAVAARAGRDAAAAARDRAVALVGHLVGDGPASAGADEHEVLVRSPIDGVVMSRDARPGEVVLVGAALVTVSREGSLVLQLRVPDAALGALREGAAVRFEVAAIPGRTFAATVTRAAPMLDTLSRTVEALARVDDATGALRAEMFATAELLGPALAPTLVVPSDAVQAIDGDTVVVRAEQRGEGLELEAVPVRVGRRSARQAEIVAGLEPGATIVARGAATARSEIQKRREARAGSGS